MKEVWTKNLKKALIWLSGYLSIIAFAIIGGYTIIKSNDEDLKKNTKWAFVVTLIFTAINAFLQIFNLCGTMSNTYYGSSAYDFYSYTSKIVAIAQIVVYAVFIIISLFVKHDTTKAKIETVEENKTQE